MENMGHRSWSVEDLEKLKPNPKVQEFIKLIDEEDCTQKEVDDAYAKRLIDKDSHHFLSYFLAQAREAQQDKDFLTGLGNRRFLESQLVKLFKEIDYQGMEHKDNPISSLTVFFIDIDYFKNINDTKGHFVGDRAIKMVANRISKITRREDIVARLGGDEFVIVWPTRGEVPPNIEELKEKLRENLHVEDESGAIPLKISIGHAIKVRGDGISSEEIIKQADENMYKDKTRDRR